MGTAAQPADASFGQAATVRGRAREDAGMDRECFCPADIGWPRRSGTVASASVECARVCQYGPRSLCHRCPLVGTQYLLLAAQGWPHQYVSHVSTAGTSHAIRRSLLAAGHERRRFRHDRRGALHPALPCREAPARDQGPSRRHGRPQRQTAEFLPVASVCKSVEAGERPSSEGHDATASGRRFPEGFRQSGISTAGADGRSGKVRQAFRSGPGQRRRL